MGKFIVVVQDNASGDVFRQSIEAEDGTQAVITAIQKASAATYDEPCEDLTEFAVMAVYPEFSDLTETIDEDEFDVMEIDDF